MASLRKSNPKHGPKAARPLSRSLQMVQRCWRAGVLSEGKAGHQAGAPTCQGPASALSLEPTQTLTARFPQSQQVASPYAARGTIRRFPVTWGAPCVSPPASLWGVTTSLLLPPSPSAWRVGLSKVCPLSSRQQEA